MRKTLVLLVVLLVSSALLALPGCGGDAAKAKEYMEKGDEYSVELKDYVENASDNVTDLLVSLGVDLAVTGTVEFETVAEQARKNIGQLRNAGGKAVAEYEKIEDLSGVEDYKKYAELRIKSLNEIGNLLEKAEDLISQLEKASAAGEPLDEKVSSWTSENKEALENAVKAGIYWGEAAKLKSDKNL
jgi:HPt (histidine-containing phosphotransfer) domain-containing protein